MRLHIEGMGVMGCLIGQLLERCEIPFTWNDTDAPVKAWPACTGVIYPSGHRLDLENHRRWTLAEWMCSGFREYGRWCYYSAKPPHGGTLVQRGAYKNIKVSEAHTVHINAVRMVEECRRRWRDWEGTTHGALTIVSHGFTPGIIHRWSWGWTALVELEPSSTLERLCRPYRPCYYMRDGYVLDYAYPVPGTRYWYAGTTLCTQRAPKQLDAEPKLLAWTERFSDKIAGAARLTNIGPLRTGWRPVPKPGAALLHEVDKRLYIRPQYGSALRHWWTTADALADVLTLRGFRLPPLTDEWLEAA